MAGTTAGASPAKSTPGQRGRDEVDRASAYTPRWIVPSTLLATVAGLGVSIYLTIAHYTTTVSLACPETSTINCEKVTTSPESAVFGIPVAVLGLVYFVAMVGFNSPPAWRSQATTIRWARLLSAVVGMGFVGWLVYSELFKVDAICLWCTSVHVINFILFCLIAIGTAATSAVNREALAG